MEHRHQASEAERALVTLGALFAGFALGLLYTSPRGKRTRVKIVDGATRQVRRLDEHVLEARSRILAAGDEAADHLRTAVGETIEKVLPSVGTEEEWRDVYVETGKDVHQAKK